MLQSRQESQIRYVKIIDDNTLFFLKYFRLAVVRKHPTCPNNAKPAIIYELDGYIIGQINLNQDEDINKFFQIREIKLESLTVDIDSVIDIAHDIFFP